MGDPKKPKEDPALVTPPLVAGTVASAGAAVGKVAAGAALASQEAAMLGGALLAIFPAVVALATAAGFKRSKRRADRFYKTIVNEWKGDSEKTAEEVAAEVEELIGERDDAADVIWRAVKGLLDAPSDRVALCLGVLAAEYLKDEKPADGFFRGVVRLLSDLSSREIDDLAAVLRLILTTTKRDTIAMMLGDRKEDGEKLPHLTWRISPDAMEDYGTMGHAVSELRPEDGPRLLYQLKINGLARDSTAAGFFDQTVIDAVMDRAVAERLARLLAVS